MHVRLPLLHYIFQQLNEEDEILTGLENITAMTSLMKSFEVSISTALIENLANGSVIGNQTVSRVFKPEYQLTCLQLFIM